MWGKLIKQFFFKYDYSNLILRKTKSFNKSRYSRNRQYYRTGVYWCLWLNIILVFALYYIFYRYTFKFSYIFIFYVVSSILCLLAFFSKNYFLGFTNAALKVLEPILFVILVELKLISCHIYIAWYINVMAPIYRLVDRLVHEPIYRLQCYLLEYSLVYYLLFVWRAFFYKVFCPIARFIYFVLETMVKRTIAYMINVRKGGFEFILRDVFKEN